jgi:hypothetical protein
MLNSSRNKTVAALETFISAVFQNHSPWPIEREMLHLCLVHGKRLISSIKNESAIVNFALASLLIACSLILALPCHLMHQET